MKKASCYIGHLYHQDRPLFLLACLFVLGMLLPLIIGFEITPFFNWKMYAYPMHPPKEYQVYQISYDGTNYNRPHTYQDYNRMMITYTLPHYHQILEQGDTLPFNTKTSNILLSVFSWNKRDNRLHMNTADLAAYPVWLKFYLESQLGRPVKSITAECVSVHYDAGNHIIADHAQKLFQQ